jgi:formate hydrogenlyase subunit 3/multisubunit Na+/H+ antiporter MnhD subunit
MAAWYVDQSQLSPDQMDMASRALLPAILGFGLLLAVFPFGTWMPVLAVDAPPLVSAFIFTAGQGMALYLLLLFVQDAPWLLTDPEPVAVIQLAGLITAASGGLMAAVQRDFGRLFGYAALGDLGVLLLALVAGGSQSQVLVLLHIVHRSVSITLLASGLAVVRHYKDTDTFAGLRGLAGQLPIASFGLLLGGLALAGFPITSGFPTHWAVSRVVWNWAQPLSSLPQEAVTGFPALGTARWIGNAAVAALAVSFLGSTVGFLRGLSAMLDRSTPVAVSDQDSDALPAARIAEPLLGNTKGMAKRAQPQLAGLLIIALAALSLILGVYPQLLLEPILDTVRGLSGF